MSEIALLAVAAYFSLNVKTGYVNIQVLSKSKISCVLGNEEQETLGCSELAEPQTFHLSGAFGYFGTIVKLNRTGLSSRTSKG